MESCGFLNSGMVQYEVTLTKGQKPRLEPWPESWLSIKAHMKLCCMPTFGES